MFVLQRFARIPCFQCQKVVPLVPSDILAAGLKWSSCWGDDEDEQRYYKRYLNKAKRSNVRSQIKKILDDGGDPRRDPDGKQNKSSKLRKCASSHAAGDPSKQHTHRKPGNTHSQSGMKQKPQRAKKGRGHHAWDGDAQFDALWEEFMSHARASSPRGTKGGHFSDTRRYTAGMKGQGKGQSFKGRSQRRFVQYPWVHVHFADADEGWGGDDEEEEYTDSWQESYEDYFANMERMEREWFHRFQGGASAEWWNQQQYHHQQTSSGYSYQSRGTGHGYAQQASRASEMKRHLEALGLPQGSRLDATTLKAAFRKSAMLWHPDKHTCAVSKASAEEKFKAAQQAYQQLSQLTA